LKEAEEIKKLKPPANKALKNDEFPYSIVYSKNENGYLSFKINKSLSTKHTILSEFKSRNAAKSFLSSFIKNNFLCEHVSGINNYQGACFEYSLGKCFGACIGEESPETYNQRINEAITDNTKFINDNFAIFDKGRTEDETAVVLIENKNYRGYAFFNNKTEVIESFEEVRNIVKKGRFDKEFNSIVKRCLSDNSLKIIVSDD